jgi:methionyl-tRNA formyltransferase
VRPAEGWTGPPLGPAQLAAGKREVWVGTATTPVLLGAVRPQGKRQMEAADWARGVRVAAGEAFDG